MNVPAGRILGDNRAYVLRRILAVCDVLALLTALLGASVLNVALDRGPLGIETTVIFLGLLPAWIGIGGVLGLYHLSDRRVDQSAADEIGPVALAATVWGWVFLLTRTAVSGGAIAVLPSISVWALTIVLVLLCRTLVRLVSRRRAWYRQRVAVVGTPVDVAHVTRRIERHSEYGLDVAWTLETENGRLLRFPPGLTAPHTDGNGANGNGRPSGIDLGDESAGISLSPMQLADLATTSSINRMIVATPPERLDERSTLIRALTEADVHVDVIAGDSDAFASNAVLHYVEGLPLLTTPSVRKSVVWAGIKRAFDCSIAGAALVLLTPMLAYIAIRIRLDSHGSVLFRQRRIGRGCQYFELLKFRTMVTDADARKEEVSSLNIHANGEASGMFKVPGDPRITKYGAKLRRWSLDEAPQLWNVLRGDMSLVGPRPLIPEEASLVPDHYGKRFTVRPGVTGPWQTLGRSDIAFEDMIKLDYTYVTNWSFEQDLRLLMRTAGAVFHGHGAY